jgi:hypothetical protein
MKGPMPLTSRLCRQRVAFFIKELAEKCKNSFIDKFLLSFDNYLHIDKDLIAAIKFAAHYNDK